MKVRLFSPQEDEFGTWILEIGQVKLGLTPQSGWSFRLREETRAIVEPQDMTPMLPLLEVGRNSIYEHLQAISNGVPEIGSRMMNFPEILLLRCAFETSVSPYWPLKGVEWLDSSQVPIAQMEHALRDLQERSWASQILKQKIKSMLKKV